MRKFLSYRQLFLILTVGLMTTGCGLLKRPTATPIYVTATSVPQTDTPTPEDTLVVGTAPADAAGPLPTLEPATLTPLPTGKATLTPSFTPLPTDTLPPKATKPAALKCGTGPQGGFALIFGQDTMLQAALGCPLGAAVAIGSASQNFENGMLLWASQLGAGGPRAIYVLYKTGAYQRYEDTWTEGVDPQTTGEIAPAGKLTPVRGFGKVWHNNAAVKSGLGWATSSEAGTDGEIQRFERGEMLFVGALGQTYIFVGGANTWRASSTGF